MINNIYADCNKIFYIFVSISSSSPSVQDGADSRIQLKPTEPHQCLLCRLESGSYFDTRDRHIITIAALRKYALPAILRRRGHHVRCRGSRRPLLLHSQAQVSRIRLSFFVFFLFFFFFLIANDAGKPRTLTHFSSRLACSIPLLWSH